MKESIIRFVMVIAVSILAPLSVRGQTTVFTYQGELQNDGQPASGVYDFKFRLFDESMDGVAVPLSPTNTGVQVTDGLFTTAVDFGQASLDGVNRWLEISVRTNGGSAFQTLNPRQLLSSTPYAVKSLEADAVPEDAITSEMLSDGSVTSAKIAAGAVSQLGSPEGELLSAVQVDSGGSVGVGTPSPSAGLHVVANRRYMIPELVASIRDGFNGSTNLRWVSAIASTETLVAAVSEVESGVTLISGGGLQYGVRSQFRHGDGVFTNLNGAASVAMIESVLAIGAKESDAVTLINVENPSQPVKLSEFKKGVDGWNALIDPVSLAMSATTLVVGADSAVLIVDITDPNSPELLSVIRDEIDGFNHLYGYNRVALLGNLLAIGSQWDDAVTLVDVGNPRVPELVSVMIDGVDGFDLLDGVADVAISGECLAIAASGDKAVSIVDIIDPAQPTVLSTWKQGTNVDSLDGVHSLTISADWLIATALIDNAVTIFDVSDPQNSFVATVARHDTGSVDLLESPSDSVISGGHLVVASMGSSSISVLSIEEEELGLVVSDRVGIGTIHPAGALHVVGDIVVDRASNIELNTKHFEVGANAESVGNYSIAMGFGTRSVGDYGFAAGYRTRAAGDFSSAFGHSSTAGGFSSTAIGASATSDGYVSTAIGIQAKASGLGAIAAGSFVVADGNYSTAMGLQSNAIGELSTAMGYRASAIHKGALVWADASEEDIASLEENSVTLRASGGYRLFSNSAGSAGASLAPDSTSWAVISDRAKKKNFDEVDGREVLETLAKIPVQRWHYNWEPAGSSPHIGPVAQDFKAAFYPGRDDKTITTLEFDGVALAAIQGLNQKLEDSLEQKEREIAELKALNANLTKRLEAVERMLE